MLKINSIRLKFWLPLLVGCSFIFLLLLRVGFGLHFGLERYSMESHDELKMTALQTALPIRRALERGSPHDIKFIIGSLSLRDDLDAIVLTDDQQNILFSSHYAWQGKPLGLFIPASSGIDASLARQLAFVDTDSRIISALTIDYSLLTEGNRKSRQAMLWLMLDSQRGRDALISDLLGIGLAELLIVCIVVFLLFWALFHYVGLPLMQLRSYAQSIAQGDYNPPIMVNGKGELANFVADIQQMAQRIDNAFCELREGQQRLSITLDSIGDAVIVTDLHGAVTRLNPEAERLTGWSQKLAQGRPVIEIFHIINAGTRQPAEHPIGRVLREGVVVGLANHTTLIAKDGTEYQISDSAAPIKGDDDEILGVIMVFQDVTQRYKLEADLNQTVTRLQAFTTSLPDPCFILSEEGEYLEVFGGSEELLSSSRNDLLGRRVAEVLPAEQTCEIMQTIKNTLLTGASQRLEYFLDVPIGKRYFEGITARLKREKDSVVIWIARDITRRKKAEENLSQLAQFDQLTGLLNRNLMMNRLEQSLARAKRRQSFGAVMFIDLDHFKDVNDSIGHQQGDQLLILVAERIRKVIRTEDLAARFGGDEFVLLLDDLGKDIIHASEKAEFIAEKLREIVSTSIDLLGHTLHIEFSIGIAMFPSDSGAEELIKHADMAMYKAKEGGRNQICFFAKHLQDITEHRLIMQRDLYQALKGDQLRLFLQPKVNVEGCWIGAEVLVRWMHPEKGLLQPKAFIPIAEKSSLIASIDSWVLLNTIQGLAKVYPDLPSNFEGLSINLSEPLMMRKGFVEELKQWFMQSALEPHLFEFEITERLLLSDYSKAAEVMDDLRKLGCRFSIDDFGTGYSSLRYLQRLPLDNLKIDKSFVDRLPGHNGDSTIVGTIIDMAYSLSMQVVAEGVESEEQRDFLAAKGCQEFQGYLFSRPLEWEEFFDKFPSKCCA